MKFVEEGFSKKKIVNAIIRFFLLGIAILLCSPSLQANAFDDCSNQHDTLFSFMTHARHDFVISGPRDKFTLCGMQAGRQYRLILNSLEKEALPAMKWNVPLHNFERVEGLRYAQAIDFVPRYECIELELQQLALPLSDRLSRLSIACIDCPKKKNLGLRAGSIKTDSLYTANQLIEDVFLASSCFDIDTNTIRLVGKPSARGVFEEGIPAIAMERGIILSTGLIDEAHGPNDAFNESEPFNRLSVDADLTKIIQSDIELWDMVKLEFSFEPTADRVSFEFVFASEEYCEYVGTEFNDVFGFFISGPGINGPFTNNAENIAIVPGTQDFVSINNVNHFDNSTFYRNNVPPLQLLLLPADVQCPGYPDEEPVAEESIQFDGMTSVLKAVANVIPCETYHIKLVIADVGDVVFDSAVFLKARSFNASGDIAISPIVPSTESNIVYEGCNDDYGYFLFERFDDNLDQPLTIDIALSSATTATEGIDFSPLPPSITIPADETTFRMDVDIYSDNIYEGTENILLDLDVPCSCESPFIEMLIIDPLPLSVNTENYIFCSPEQVAILADVNGGIEDYVYEWSTGATTDFITVSPNSTAEYSITVTDACGVTTTSTSDVQVVNTNVSFNTIDLISEVELDLGETFQLQPLLSFPSSTPNIISWEPTEGLSCSDCLTPIVTPVETTTYTLTVIDQYNCISTADVDVRLVKTYPVFIPNVFSPLNVDGINDRFVIYARSHIVRQINRVAIFDRWGELMYEVKDIAPNDNSIGWDGTFKGQDVPVGVYLYLVEVEFIDNTSKRLTGTVTIVE